MGVHLVFWIRVEGIDSHRASFLQASYPRVSETPDTQVSGILGNPVSWSLDRIVGRVFFAPDRKVCVARCHGVSGVRRRGEERCRVSGCPECGVLEWQYPSCRQLLQVGACDGRRFG